MGYEISVVAELRKSPNAHEIEVLDRQFEALEHAPGSKIVTIAEHVSMNDESAAIEFVRALVIEALPDRSTITSVTATPD